MLDMSSTIVAKSDQQNAIDFLGRTLDITITKVSKIEGEQPVHIGFDSDGGKPWKPCKSMLRVLVFIWGLDGTKWVGKKLTLYREEKVKWAGAEVGGIRISHMSGIDKPVTVALQNAKNSIKPYTVQPFKEKADPELDSLKTAGKNAANKGMDALTAWKGSLTAPQKLKLGKEFGEELTKIAEGVK